MVWIDCSLQKVYANITAEGRFIFALTHKEINTKLGFYHFINIIGTRSYRLQLRSFLQQDYYWREEFYGTGYNGRCLGSAN